MVEKQILVLYICHTMSLNIKSHEADELVAEVARLTGETKTQAVIESLKQRLVKERARVERESLAADLLKIGEKCANYGASAVSHGDLLYGEDGLPE